MDFYLNSQTYGALRFKRVVPASFAKRRLPGSHPYSSEGAFGKIFLQQFTSSGIQFVYTICRIKQDLVLDFNIPGRPWLIPISLKNENRFDIGSQIACLKKGQYNMIRATGSATLYMERDNDYESICFSFDRQQLQELCLLLPLLNSFIHHSYSKTPGFVFRNNKRIDSQLSNIIKHLLHCSYRGDIRRRYFDYKVKELVLLLINKRNTGNIASAAINDRTGELIKQAKFLMKSRVNQSATLYKIARQLGMDKLKMQNESS